MNRNIEKMKPSASVQLMAKAKQMKKLDPSVIDLAGGEPDFATPDRITVATIRSLTEGNTHYMVGPGIPELRQAIQKKLEQENGIVCSAGNCSTELLVAALQREGYLKDVDLLKLLQYLDDKLIPAMAQYDYRPAVSPQDLVLGMSGCHFSFLGLFQRISKEQNVPLYPLIMQVSALDRKAPPEDLIRDVAQKLKA